MNRTQILERLAIISKLPSAGASLDTVQNVRAELRLIAAQLVRPEHATAIVRAFVSDYDDRWRSREVQLAEQAKRKPKPLPVVAPPIKKHRARHEIRSRLIGSNPLYARDTWRDRAARAK